MKISFCFSKAAVILFILILPFIASSQVQQKRMYEISTEKLDSVNRQLINVTEDSFRVAVTLPSDSFAVKKATMYINDKNEQIITGQLPSMLFTITDFNSITLKIEVAKKSYHKKDSLEVDSLTDLKTRKYYLLTPGDHSSFLKENKITSYSVSPVKMPYPKTEVQLGDAVTYTIVFINAIDLEGRSLRNSNLIVGALIKTLAGARPQDELIDLFIKLNYGRQKKFFSLIGADVGIGSVRDSTDTTGLFRINEGIANFNWALYRRARHQPLSYSQIRNLIKTEVDAAKQNPSKDTIRVRIQATEKYYNLADSLRKLNALYIDSNLRRTAFFGAGLKIFHSIPYVGVHFGSIEINGPLFGSYIFAGYYYSPYLKNIITRDSLGFQNYKHNIYLEASVNAFGSRVPNVLKTVRLKFGLMFPIRDKKGDKQDMFPPESKDVISRLAIEVPLGTVFRF